jgi:hypothetical protein
LEFLKETQKCKDWIKSTLLSRTGSSRLFQEFGGFSL